MVRSGHAYADRRIGHTLQSPFEQAEADARKKGRGLWRGVTEAQTPAWRRAWLERLRDEKKHAAHGAPSP
jgi:endonuclease YncB( thermonuclease family)